MPPVSLTWHQGENKPKIWKEKGIPQWGSGILFIGDKGMLLSDYSKHILLPEKSFNVVQQPRASFRCVWNGHRYHRRTSSAHWEGDRLTSPEEANHRRRMGY